MAIQSDWTDPSVSHSREPVPRHSVRRASDRRCAAIGALGKWMIHCKPRPVFLVDEHLEVICSNPAAQKALERIGWMRRSESHLEILDSDLRRQLLSALSAWPAPESPSIELTWGFDRKGNSSGRSETWWPGVDEGRIQPVGRQARSQDSLSRRRNPPANDQRPL